jgi:hypothetical protein
MSTSKQGGRDTFCAGSSAAETSRFGFRLLGKSMAFAQKFVTGAIYRSGSARNLDLVYRFASSSVAISSAFRTRRGARFGMVAVRCGGSPESALMAAPGCAGTVVSGIAIGPRVADGHRHWTALPIRRLGGAIVDPRTVSRRADVQRPVNDLRRYNLRTSRGTSAAAARTRRVRRETHEDR